MSAILATKLGMTQMFLDDGTVARVTVLQAGPCPVTAIRTPDRDGYDAVQLAFGEPSRKALTKPRLGHLAKVDAPPMRRLANTRCGYAGRVGSRSCARSGWDSFLPSPKPNRMRPSIRHNAWNSTAPLKASLAMRTTTTMFVV